MESLRKRVKLELVSSPQRMRKLINRPTFKHCITYSDNLAAVSLHNKVIHFCKPIYIGFTILELSKYHMYDYHYNVMKRHYGARISLLYTDTGMYIDSDNYIIINIINIYRFSAISSDDG